MSSKEEIRQKIWSYLEENNIAQYPRPVYKRIPNFEKSDIACEKATELSEFKNARVVKINQDKPPERIRFRTIEARKTLLVPTPRLRSGLFNRIEPPDYNKETLRTCASSEGVKCFSKPIGLDSKIKIDLIIVGSVAVSKEGNRIGKGEGYADLEYGMMASLGAIDPITTTVVTTVHDSQVFDCLSNDMFGEHDLNVDIIVTPTQVIRCEQQIIKPKPKAIIWSLITKQRLKEIPILNTFRNNELNSGKDITLFD